MTTLRVLFAVWLLVWGILGSQRAVAGSSKVWESRYLFAEAIAEIEQNGQAIWGVLLLKQPFCEVWSFHFTGTIAADAVEASHHSGHHFVGKLVNDREITGILTTKTGMCLTITARRR